jgi:hypothetical protein
VIEDEADMAQSFLVVSALLTTVLTPALIILLRALTAPFGEIFGYLPAGPTPLIFALLVQYHAIVPPTYKYRLALSTAAPTSTDQFVGLTLSNKTYRYLLAVQLALFQWPGSVVAAGVGWIVGHSWRSGLLPGALTRWRIPGWMVGVRAQKRTDEFEGLRRRLEGENSATATGVQSQAQAEAGRRRTMGQQLMDQFRNAL